MSNSTESAYGDRVCPQCGAELPEGVAPEFCPKCLLARAMGPKTELAEGTGSAVSGVPSGPFIQPGQTFGHYSIIRPIGGGGMGSVFEAEDLENNRRVALKILSHRLDAPEARERFFREGRLAAAINHPNSVYIFGTEEVAGIPVIAMELVPGGTLQDRVRSRGPMPPGEAVDAVLQIIEGLEAAQKAGILHRDIKPSNCFVDPGGGVKIGDFGLSISTAVRTEPALTSDGAFLGTPSFCPPEQLRGEELNVRSDIYAVGATLYYLLTGRTPFEAQNVVALIATVLEKASPSPREVRPEISQGLAKVVQRCLHKQRGERFASYEELRRALEPYSSAAPVPAPLGMRFLAGVIDVLSVSVFFQIVMLLVFGGVLGLIDQMSAPGPRGLLLIAAGLAATTLYYALLEGFLSSTLGKAVCQLRVVRVNRSLPGFGRALVRALIWVWLPILPFWTVAGFLSEGGWKEFFNTSKMTAFFPGTNGVGYYLLAMTPYVVMGLLFATARRRNGFAAIQDLASGTKVIVRSRAMSRIQPALEPQSAPSRLGAGSVGPYQIIEKMEEGPGGHWLLGFDMRLLRKVWIRQLVPGTAPFPIALRNLGRPWRLRWLTGKRIAEESWDAFEAPTGRPLLRIIEKPQSWEQVRFWLWDLAREISTSSRDGTAPGTLSLDRIWITAEGTAKILDFPAPGLSGGGDAASYPLERAHDFLAYVGVSALHGQVEVEKAQVRVPLPLHARQFLSRLSEARSLDPLLPELAGLLRRPAAVTHVRRAMMVAGCAAFPLLTLASLFFGTGLLGGFEERYPDLLRLNQLLSQKQSLKFVPHSNAPSEKDFAIYIGRHYGGFITNEARWRAPLVLAMIGGKSRAFAEQSIEAAARATPAEIQKAEKALKGMDASFKSVSINFRKPTFLAMAALMTMLIYVGLPALVAAAAFRGGLVLLLARVAFVGRDGHPASRLRLIWRSVVAWTPLLLAAVVAAAGLGLNNPWIGVLAGAVLLGIASISLACANRGLQDRLAGTWPVPK